MYIFIRVRVYVCTYIHTGGILDRGHRSQDSASQREKDWRKKIRAHR